MLKQTRDTMGVDEVEEQVGNAIELAIIGKAKRFIKSSTCQKVIDGIWRYDQASERCKTPNCVVP